MATKKENKPRNRGVALDGERVAKYRLAMGFTQEQLAVAIDAADPKTIQRIEAGEPTTFLSKLAEVFGVHPTQLIPDLSKSNDPPKSNQTKERMRFSVFLEEVPPDMKELFKREPLAAKLYLLCQLQGIVRDGAPNVTLEFGSIIISADLTKADVMRMTKAFMSGELSYLGVTYISCANLKSQTVREGESKPDRKLSVDEPQALLAYLYQRLDQEQFIILLLVYYVQLTQASAGNIMGMEEDNVRRRLRQIKKLIGQIRSENA